MWHCSYQEFNNQDKYRSRELFVTNKIIKRLTEYARNFTQFLILAYDMCFNSKFKNQCPLTRLFHFFQRTAQTPGHDQQNGN